MKNMKNQKTLLLGALLVGLIIICIYGFLYIQKEQKNIKIDEYNFSQLEKVKLILNDISEEDELFFTLKEFNERYDGNIEPIKNCYYVSNSNGAEPYIFSFKLESNKYIKTYGGEFYSYPKYDKPVEYFCGGSSDCTDDIISSRFRAIIKRRCAD